MNDDIRKRLRSCIDRMIFDITLHENFNEGIQIPRAPFAMKHIAPLVEDLAAKLEVANHENTIKHNQICTLKGHLDANAGNYWAWQGDGEDHLESLSCSVVIRPEDLREILEKLAAAAKERDEAIKVAMHYFMTDPESTLGRFCKKCGHYLTAPWHIRGNPEEQLDA